MGAKSWCARLMVSAARPLLHRRRRHQGHVAQRVAGRELPIGLRGAGPAGLPPPVAAPADDAPMWLVGVVYAATLVLFVTATKLTTSANAIFLQDTSPLYVLLLSPLVLGERVRRADVLFMLALAAGLLAFFFGHDQPLDTTAPNPFLGRSRCHRQRRHLGGDDHRPALAGNARSNDAEATQPALVAGNVLAFCAALPFALPVTATTTTAWAIVALSRRHPDRAGLCLLLDRHGRRSRDRSLVAAAAGASAESVSGAGWCTAKCRAAGH